MVVLLVVSLAFASVHLAQAQQPEKVSEFTDNQYNYTFQFPSDWKMKPPPPKGEEDLGEVRAVIQGPRAALMIVVGQVGKSVSESQYRSNPNSDQLVKSLIDLSIEQYKKMSKTFNASRMTVLESKALPSNMAIRFYISTLHIIDGKPVLSHKFGTTFSG